MAGKDYLEKKRAKQKLIQKNLPKHPDSMIDKRKLNRIARKKERDTRPSVNKDYFYMEYDAHSFFFKTSKEFGSLDYQMQLLDIRHVDGLELDQRYKDLSDEFMNKIVSVPNDIFRIHGVSVFTGKKDVYECFKRLEFNNGNVRDLMSIINPVSIKPSKGEDSHFHFSHDIVYVEMPDGKKYIGESNLNPDDSDKENYIISLKNAISVYESKINKKRELKISRNGNDKLSYSIRNPTTVHLRDMRSKKLNISRSYIVSGIDNIITEFMFKPGYHELTDRLWDSYMMSDDEKEKKEGYEAAIAEELETKRQDKIATAKMESERGNGYSSRVTSNNDSLGIAIKLPEDHSYPSGYSSGQGKPKKKKSSWGTGMKSLKDI